MAYLTPLNAVFDDLYEGHPVTGECLSIVYGPILELAEQGLLDEALADGYLTTQYVSALQTVSHQRNLSMGVAWNRIRSVFYAGLSVADFEPSIVSKIESIIRILDRESAAIDIAHNHYAALSKIDIGELGSGRQAPQLYPFNLV